MLLNKGKEAFFWGAVYVLAEQKAFVKSFITVDTLNWPTPENKLVLMLPGGMLFLKRKPFASKNKLNMWWSIQWWLHLNCAKVVLASVSCGRQNEELVLNGSWHCLHFLALALSTNQHVMYSYRILSLKGCTSYGKSYFKFEVSLHRTSSLWVEINPALLRYKTLLNLTHQTFVLMSVILGYAFYCWSWVRRPLQSNGVITSSWLWNHLVRWPKHRSVPTQTFHRHFGLSKWPLGHSGCH